MTAPKEPDLPVVLKRSLDVDANDAVLAMGALDLLSRAIRDDRIEDIDLAGGNEMVPLVGAARRLVHHARGRPAATGLYSIVTLADLITVPQRSVSSLTILAMFAGVPPTAVRCIRA